MVILEIPDDLHSPPEKSQWMNEQALGSFDDSMPFIEKYNRVAFQDQNLTVFPLRASNKNGDEVYSFIGIPSNAPPKFNPTKARELGCDPRIHFKSLAAGNAVELENGNKIEPEMVTEPQKHA